MKNLYFTLIFISFITTAQAQKISFTDTSNIWRYRYSDVATNIGYDFHYADTIITIDTVDYHLLQATQVYRNITTQGNGDIFFRILIREDTTAKKIYTRVYDLWHANIKDSNENLLFDYSLQIGDTVTRITPDNDTFIHYVIKIDKISMNNTDHKVFHFKPIKFPATYYYVIEGIGCVTGPVFPLYPTQFESDFSLFCFTNNGLKPPVNPTVGFLNNTTSCYTIVADIEHSNKQVTYPQPANIYTNIKLPEKIQSGSISIYNSLGQLMHTEAIKNKELLEINNPGNLHGMYYYRITDNTENKVYSGKLLFE